MLAVYRLHKSNLSKKKIDQHANELQNWVKANQDRKKYKGNIINNDKDVAMLLLKEKLVSVVHGEAFGLSPYFRISYATSMENLQIACERIKEFSEELVD